MRIIIDIIEGFILLGGGIWLILYYTGHLKYSGEKEERRQRKVEKYGWGINLCGLICVTVGVAIILKSVYALL